MSDLLVVGESLIDVVPDAAGGVRRIVGGSALNVAVAASRLGAAVTLRTRIGADTDGDAIAARLADDGVLLAPGSRGARATGTAEVVLDASGSANYRFDLDWVADDLLLPPAVRAVHTGSIAAYLAPGGAQVAAFVEALPATVAVSFDPNIRPQLVGDHAAALAVTERVVARADLVKASDEDVAWLYPDLDVDAVLARWAGLGAGVAVVTRGADGVVGMTAGERVAVAAETVAVVDTIGAGDTATAALVHRLLLTRGDAASAVARADLRDAMAFAARCAALTVGRPGADPPRLDEVL